MARTKKNSSPMRKYYLFFSAFIVLVVVLSVTGIIASKRFERDRLEDEKKIEAIRTISGKITSSYDFKTRVYITKLTPQSLDELSVNEEDRSRVTYYRVDALKFVLCARFATDNYTGSHYGAKLLTQSRVDQLANAGVPVEEGATYFDSVENDYIYEHKHGTNCYLFSTNNTLNEQ